MFPLLNILAALPWRLIGGAVLFAGGCQFGANRVTDKWDAEKASGALVAGTKCGALYEFLVLRASACAKLRL